MGQAIEASHMTPEQKKKYHALLGSIQRAFAAAGQGESSVEQGDVGELRDSFKVSVIVLKHLVLLGDRKSWA